MKWIGQHIYDLISRFRNDVYLESISSGTIASGGNLGLDSNNKIVKAAVSSGGISHDGSTADGVLTYKDADEATVEAYLTFANSGNTSTLSLLSDQDTGDKFTIATTTHGATIIRTTDDDAAAANLTLDVDGIIELDGTTIGGSGGHVRFLNDGTRYSDFSVHHNASYLTMYENGGASTDDFFSIAVAANGATTLSTLDSAGTDANLNFSIDGTFSIASSTGIDIETDGTIGNAIWNGTEISVAKGGTGATSLTDGGILLGSGTNAITAMAVLADGEMIVGDGTTDPVAESGATLRTSIGVGTGDSPQFTGIELGHASDTSITRSASGVIAVEGKNVITRDKVIYIETANFSDDIDTDAHYIPFVTTSEHENFANVAVPFVAPAPGKLLGVHYKANNHTHTSSNTVTFRLDRLDDGILWSSGNEATIGTKVVDGVNRVNTCSADFTDLTTAGASGTNAFDANEMIGVSLQNSVNFTSTKYSVTLVFEFDFSSYYS